MRISDEKRREVAATMRAISCRGVKDLTLGEVLGLCQNPAKNERGELAAADVERARRALRTYVFGAGASERTGNSLRAGEGEGDGRR